MCIRDRICFPPNEACSPKAMTERIAKVPQLFLVAIDKSTGKLAGFLNGEMCIRDRDRSGLSHTLQAYD